MDNSSINNFSTSTSDKSSKSYDPSRSSVSSDPTVVNGESRKENIHAASMNNKAAGSKEETNSAVSKVGNSECRKDEVSKIDSKENNDNTDVPMEIDEDIDNIPRLVIEGVDDDDEESQVLTVEEAQNYIREKVKEYMKDPKINPLLVVQNGISDFHGKIQQKNEDFNRLSKVFEVLYRDQVKFLRHIGVMSKAETKTVGVGVDLPWLPETMSTLLNNETVKQDNILSKAALVTKSVLPKKDTKKEPSGPVECIDLTDDDAAVSARKDNIINSAAASAVPLPNSATHTRHPAPLPFRSLHGNTNDAPPKPSLKISEDDKGKGGKGLVLQWDLPISLKNSSIKSFEIYGYQEKNFMTITSDLWKKIGSVEPMPLPMSCTLTQFQEGYRYHFAIRAVCANGSYGCFSDPKYIMYAPSKTKN